MPKCWTSQRFLSSRCLMPKTPRAMDWALALGKTLSALKEESYERVSCVKVFALKGKIFKSWMPQESFYRGIFMHEEVLCPRVVDALYSLCSKWFHDSITWYLKSCCLNWGLRAQVVQVPMIHIKRVWHPRIWMTKILAPRCSMHPRVGKIKDSSHQEFFMSK